MGHDWQVRELTEPGTIREYLNADRLYAAYWDEELDTEDPEVLCALASDIEVDPAFIAETVATGGLLPALGASMMRANEWGVTGTPGYVIANALQIPGLQEDDFWDRIIQRLRERGIAE